MRFHTKFETKTCDKLDELSKTSIVILRREYGENKLWCQCSIEEAFDDILYSDRWGCDDYIYESESLRQFALCFTVPATWRKTERFMFRFINFSEIDAIFSNLKKQDAVAVSFDNPEDDFLLSL